MPDVPAEVLVVATVIPVTADTIEIAPVLVPPDTRWGLPSVPVALSIVGLNVCVWPGSVTTLVAVWLWLTTIAPHATAGTALAGTTTVTCTTLAGQTFATGETVTVVAGTGYTFTQNGVSGLTSVTARITYATATTFTLNGVVGAGTNTSAPTFTKAAQASFGSIADVNADALANGSAQTATQTLYQYNCAIMRGTYPVSTNGSLQVADVFEATLWYPANLILTDWAAFTNTAALETELAKLVV